MGHMGIKYPRTDKGDVICPPLKILGHKKTLMDHQFTGAFTKVEEKKSQC